MWIFVLPDYAAIWVGVFYCVSDERAAQMPMRRYEESTLHFPLLKDFVQRCSL